MGQDLTGFIVKMDLAPKVAEREPRFKAIELRQGFVLFPVFADLLHAIFPKDPGEPDFPDMLYLSGDFAKFLIDLSESGRVMYFSSDYFAGLGDQAAIVFDHGNIICRGDSGEVKKVAESKGPINQALAHMGVRSMIMLDHFGTVGLDKIGDSQEVYEAINEKGNP